MTRTMTAAMALAACAGLGVFTSPARAGHEVALVQEWYSQYLHRPIDPVGLHSWVGQLRCGASPEAVQAGILGSEEYYCLHGHTPAGFVAGLYADVLGREACAHELHPWVCRLQQLCCRQKVAAEFLCAARIELAQRAGPVFTPPPPPFGDPGLPGPLYPARGVGGKVRVVRR